METCLLCKSINTQEYYKSKDRTFYTCLTCDCVFIPTAQLPNQNTEKQRYLLHQNNIEDKGFQKFVMPIVDAVKANFNINKKGLDFGAGTGPVISKLLQDLGYTLNLYDPFFYPDTTPLTITYDYIVCCEVIEHFHNPLKEFHLLKSLLNKNGKLYCMTDLLPPKNTFATWYYKNDSTHVLFYTPKTLEWIKNEVGFNHLEIQERLITFW